MGNVVIRTQDKTALVNITGMTVELEFEETAATCRIVAKSNCCEGIKKPLGKYKNLDDAVTVLDQLVNFIDAKHRELSGLKLCDRVGGSVFKMPKETDVWK
jgi:hypothetical protein